MSRILVQPKHSGETRTEYVDFSPFLVAGQAISSVSAACSVYAGADPSAAAMITLTSFSGPVVAVTIAAGIVGNIYQVVVSVNTTGPTNVLQLSFYLAIVTDLP